MKGLTHALPYDSCTFCFIFSLYAIIIVCEWVKSLGEVHFALEYYWFEMSIGLVNQKEEEKKHKIEIEWGCSSSRFEWFACCCNSRTTYDFVLHKADTLQSTVYTVQLCLRQCTPLHTTLVRCLKPQKNGSCFLLGTFSLCNSKWLMMSHV